MVLNTVESEVVRLMREGQAAAKRGDKVMARALLTQLLEHEPHNEKAWMWLSGAVSDLVEQQTCLENVLIINPSNAQARKGLEFISTKTGVRSPVLDRVAPGTPTSGAPEAASYQQSALPTPAPTHLLDPANDPFQPFQQPANVPAGPAHGSPEMSHAAAPGNGGDLSPWSRDSLEYTSPLSVTDVPEPSGPVTLSIPEPGSSSIPPWDQVSPSFGNGHSPLMDPPMPDFAAMDMYAGGPPTPAAPPDLDNAIPDWVKGVSGSPEVPPLFEEMHDVQPFSLQDAHADLPPSGLATSGSLPAGDAQGIEDGIDAWLSKFATGNIALPQTDPSLKSAQLPQEPQPAPQNNPLDPFAAGAMGFDGMGPYGAMSLPSPDELPGNSPSHGGGTQPWYLQGSSDPAAPRNEHAAHPEYGSQNDHSHTDGTGMQANSQAVTLVPCPNCREQVPDTSLACPNCRYNFFVHCPSCHELIDTTDARPGVTEACQYCGVAVNRFELGQMYAAELKAPVMAEPTENKDSWIGTPITPPKQRTLNLAWVVDVMWLLAIAMVVWALTQLPAWFNLTGLYN